MSQQVTDDNGNPSGKWYDPNGGPYLDYDPDAAPVLAPLNHYDDFQIYGPTLAALGLINDAARAQGIDPATVDWDAYAVPVARAVGSYNGTGGYLLGTNEAYVANLILREIARGTVAGRTDPRFAAKAAIFAPDPSGANGYYGNTGAVYRSYEAQGVQRDVALRAQRAAEGGGFADLVPLIILAGFTAGASGVFAAAASAAEVAAVPAISEAALFVEGAAGTLEAFGPTVLDTSAWSLGTGAGSLTSDALVPVLANTGFVPAGYTVNLANSAELVADAAAWNTGTGAGSLTSDALVPVFENTGFVPAGYTVNLANSAELVAEEALPALPSIPAAVTSAVISLATSTAAKVLASLIGADVKPADIPAPSNNVLAVWAVLGIGGALVTYFIFKG